MTVHVKKRGAAWYFWAELERGPDGKRRQKSQGGSDREAERAFAELHDDVRRGVYTTFRTLSLTRYMKEE